MKKYLIKIDLNSIKKNENAGSTVTNIYIGKTTTFKAHSLPNNFKDGENCIIQQCKIIDDYCYDYEGILIDENILNEIYENNSGNIEIKIEAQYNTIYHEPIPEYSYFYKNKKVKCNSCGTKIMTNELEYDENNDNSYSYTVCPKCHEWECVELEYEKIKDALKRLNKNN